MRCVYCGTEMDDFTIGFTRAECSNCHSYYDKMSQNSNGIIIKAHPHFSIKVNTTFRYIMIKF